MSTPETSSPLRARKYETPVGTMSVIANETSVVAGGFCEPEDLIARIGDDPTWELTENLEPFETPIQAYLGGDLAALDGIPVEQPGTDLQQQVWNGLRSIPAGQTASYSELATTTDKPKAVRAVGTACGRNLVAPIVPCHRALRSDGSLGGYLYGLEVKRWLLSHEGSRLV